MRNCVHVTATIKVTEYLTVTEMFERFLDKYYFWEPFGSRNGFLKLSSLIEESKDLEPVWLPKSMNVTILMGIP